MFIREILKEFYSPEDDELSIAKMSDTRRPRISLRHLHKLRKMREIKQADKANHLKFVKVIYSAGKDSEEY